MEEQTTGKELVLTAPVTIAKRSKPVLVEIAGRQLSSDGRWHPELAVEYLLARGRSQWMKIGELARTFYHASIPNNKKRVRRRIPMLFNRMLAVNELLVYETDANTGRITAVKVYDPNAEQDRQSIRAKLERMEARKQLTFDQFDKAIQLVDAKEHKNILAEVGAS